MKLDENQIDDLCYYGITNYQPINTIKSESDFFDEFIEKHQSSSNNNPILYYIYMDTIIKYLKLFQPKFHLAWLKSAKCELEEKKSKHQSIQNYFLRIEVLTDLIENKKNKERIQLN